MLAEITEFEKTVTLVSDTGIQFMDFALNIDERKEPAGDFVSISSEKLLTRLLTNDDKDYQFYPLSSGSIQRAEPDFDIAMKDSLTLLDGLWLPCPIFRSPAPDKFEEGPTNWARMRLVKLAEPDINGNSHRLTLAFDTRIMGNTGTAYLAPNHEDVGVGIDFRMACHTWEMGWFLDEKGWVNNWLREIFIEANEHRLSEEIEEELQALHYQAHYLNLLSLFSRPLPAEQTQRKPKAEIPDIRVVANIAKRKIIPVDLILDVGNSRTCGILIEDHGQDNSGMKQNYVLQLRDLQMPEQVYQDPFESRVEFGQANFGKDHHAVKSGRHDAFQWPTIARVGKEAGRLASRRLGTEGSTGLSSPKRYLWDEEAYTHAWRFNSAYVKTDTEALATAAPFSYLINDTGEALYAIKNEDDRMPVFTPEYSRSSLMTFMLAEVLTQALCQINSPAQRSRQGHARTPRQLNSVILTVPPGMPLAERSILNERLQQAIALVWKSMGWHEGDNDPWQEKETQARIPMPKVRVEWDEASCGQLVYLYNEITHNFMGQPEALFATLARPDKTDRERITLATIDIGGGTTDLVITDYSMHRSGGSSIGSNAYIKPEQRFRDGFKIAGDDIVLDVIQQYVLPGFTRALATAGVSEPDALMSRLCGGESLDARDQVLRQQLNLQVFTPLSLAILKEYESYDPEQSAKLFQYTYREILGDGAVSDAVQEYVNGAIRREVGPSVSFDLLANTLSVSIPQLHEDFMNGELNITKTLAALCEVITCYPCDMLLLTGRPSRLPGVQAYIRQLLPLPADRILPMQGYRTGGWYPFHKNGLIDDPKSTAAVGAMLCLLCANRSIASFHFMTLALKPYSTIRHIGLILKGNTIEDENVLFGNIETEEGDFQKSYRIKLPEVNGLVPELEMRGLIRLGFRQLDAARWVATPLYTLNFTAQGSQLYAEASAAQGEEKLLRVRFKVDSSKAEEEDRTKLGLISDRLMIDSIETPEGYDKLKVKHLKLSLNTMLDSQGLDNSKYWLDSGSVKI